MVWQNGLQFDTAGNLLVSGAAGTNPFAATTAAETTAGVTPVNTGYAENDIRRYAASFGTNDNAAWTAVTAVASQNGRQVYLAGLTLNFPSANITWNQHAHGIDGDNCTLTFGGANGLVISSSDNGYQQAYQTGGFRRFQIVGSGKAGGGIGVKFGTTGNPIFGAMAVIDSFSIVSCQTGMSWGNSSWLQSIGNGCIQSCAKAMDFPSGLVTSGEAIGFGHMIVSNNDNGISCAGGQMLFAHLAMDYNTGYAISCSSNGKVRANLFHLESNTDTDYWLKVTGSGSEITLDDGDIFNALSGKTSFAVGQANNTGACAINFGKVLFQGFTEANYGFNYVIDGHGYIAAEETVDQTTGSGTSAAVPFKEGNLLLDSGFESAKIIDWISGGVGNQAAISTAQHFAGTQSMTQAPTAGNRAFEIVWAAVQPGVWVKFAARMIFAGTASTDVVNINIQFFDENGAAISTNAVTRTITPLPSSWTRYVVAPFGPAPAGSRYVQIYVNKQAAGGGGSDGNGAVFWDDAYLSITGGVGRLVAAGEFPPNCITAKTAAFSVRLAKGCAVDGIRIVNNTANAVTGGIKIGSTGGGVDISTAVAVGANAEVYVPYTANAATGLAKNYLTSTGAQTWFFDAVTSWNSASLTFDIILKRIMTQGY